MTEAQERYHTAAMAFAADWNKALKLEHAAMLEAIQIACDKAEAAGIDPAKVGLD